MRSRTSLCLGIALLCLAVVHGSIVANITTKNFEEYLADTKNSYVVLAFKKNCTEVCMSHYSLLESSAASLEAKEPNLKVIAANITKMLAVQDELELRDPHGVFYLHQGEIIRLDNSYSKDEAERDLISEISLAIHRKYDEIDTEDEFKELISKHDYVHLVYTEPLSTMDRLASIGAKFTDRPVRRVNKDIADLLELQKDGFYTYDKDLNISTEWTYGSGKDALVQFLYLSTVPILRDFDETAVNLTLDHGFNMILTYSTNSSESDIIHNGLIIGSTLLRNHAHAYKLTNKNHKYQAKFFKLCQPDSQSQKTFFICFVGNQDKGLVPFLYEKKKVSYDLVVGFLEKVDEGSLVSKLPSENIDQPMTGKVQNLNLDSYSELMSISEKGTPQHLVIYYYKDKCEACRKFDGAFLDTANNNPRKSVIFGRINLSKNNIPDLEGTKVPFVHHTIGFDFPTIDYTGNYTADNFSEWTEKSFERMEDYLSEHADL